MSVVDEVVGVLAPHLCIACGTEGAVLCSRCLETAGEPLPERCAGCKQLSESGRTCESCRSWLEVYSVRVAAPYEGIYEQLVQSYKFDVQRQASSPIASMMCDVANSIPQDSIICPLPTAPSRIRERGFDHSVLLARKFCTMSGRQTKNLLGRKTNVRQLGSSRAQRMKQMQEEFYVTRPDEVERQNIVLLDDVVTTGASLSAAAKKLKKAGAKKIYAIVFAQKP